MRKTDKRERILDAAFQIFLTKGLNDTKMIDIAEMAGIGKGTIYEYFSSKDELFKLLFERKVFSVYRGLEETLSQKETAKEKLMAFVSFDSFMTNEMEISHDVIYNLMVDTGCRCGSAARNCVKQLMEYRFSALHKIISSGVESGEFVKMDPLMSTVAVMGSLAFYLSFNHDFFPEKHLAQYEKKAPWKDEEFLDIFLHGICRESTCA